MAVTVTIQGRLKGGTAEMKQLHDEVTGATKEMAKAAGDISHKVFLNPQDERDFLGIDEWQSAEQVQAFSSDPRIQDFFARLFEGQPQVKLWVDSDWNQW
jgi:quinol monooxygenase YgiN